MIEVQNIDKSFNAGTVNEAQLFHDFSLSVGSGEFVSVVGSNGSGKTTLLNIINGTIPIDSGRVILDGKDISALPEYRRARTIGRVFQDPSVGTVGSMSILENLSLAENKGKPYGLSFMLNSKKRDQFLEMVASLGLGLEDRADIPMGLLSGGQRQAVALLMATITPIRILILDEHTAALDPHTADVIMELTDRVVREKGLTAMMVTHNLRYAVQYGSRLIMMDKGRTVVDRNGKEKTATSVDDLLSVFNAISIECGN